MRTACSSRKISHADTRNISIVAVRPMPLKGWPHIHAYVYVHPFIHIHTYYIILEGQMTVSLQCETLLFQAHHSFDNFVI